MMRRMSRQSGLTLLEVLIATIILSLMVAASSWLVWSSANTVTDNQTWVQMELSARETVDQIVKELHQCRAGKILKIDTTKPIPTDSVSMAALTSPGTTVAYPVWSPSALITPTPPPFPSANNIYTNPTKAVWNPADATNPVGAFDGIRFWIAGPMMELTAVTKAQQVMTSSGQVATTQRNNASADNNGTVDPTDPTGKRKIWNFDLTKFKLDPSQNSAEWTYEISYWWEIDQQATNGKDAAGVKGEGTQNANSPSGYLPDGIDNNGNGVVDEGVVKKMETWYYPDGTVFNRVVTTVCKDVTALQFSIPGWPESFNHSAALAATATTLPSNGYKPGAERSVVISLTLKRADPRYPKDPLKVLVKTVTAFVDLRN